MKGDFFMITFQDYQDYSGTKEEFITYAIGTHKNSDKYKIAIEADLYDRQLNKTINEFVQTIFTLTGISVENYTVSNNKIACNLFNRLNTQRVMYSLGNGITFNDDNGQRNDKIKNRLGGDKFDTDVRKLVYKGLIHGVSFGYWNYDRLYTFPLTELVPLFDEYTGELRACIRFWQMTDTKPLTAILFEEDGYTKYQTDREDKKLNEIEPKHGYKQRVRYTPADGESIVGYENYSSLPVIPFYGSRLHQSTLVGMKSAIDSYDIIRSGFANDLSDCSQIYWIINNCGGMSDIDRMKFIDKLRLLHVVGVDSDEASVTPYTQEIPYSARSAYLEMIKSGIYEDFGALDVHTIAAGATNDHIDAAYQPMDENADDFEYQVIEFMEQLLKLIGIPNQTPIFKRNRISNQMEQVNMLVAEAAWLDEETILKKLPNITFDEVQGILERKQAEDITRMTTGNTNNEQINENGAETPYNEDEI